MRRLIAAFPIALALSMVMAVPTFAATYYHFSYPCQSDAGKYISEVKANNWEWSDGGADECTEVAVKLQYRTSAGGTIYAQFDYDGNYAVVDKPNNYIFYAAWAQCKDDGVSSGFIGW